jgi:hypothetical protein
MKGAAAAKNATADATTGKEGKGANAAAPQPASIIGGDQDPDLSSIVQGLTGIDLGSIGLRSLPKLDARKKQNAANSTAAAGGVCDPMIKTPPSRQRLSHRRGLFDGIYH